ncbi:MAG TPA: carboxypeptidase regulatory-like domain-containing protein [Edaphobacter sp.]|nr:carboxypeptidase regulatory-like domain-containing protein [Edaphobacter sp.]
MRERAFLRVFLLVILGLLSHEAWGQGYGTINGQITDPTGAAVEGATITITNAGTGQTRVVATGQDGFYTITSVNPSTYDLTVDKTGFKKALQKDVTLQASQSLTLDISLTIGATSDSVTVNAEAVQVDTTTPTLKEVVDSTRMVEIPLNGRNAASLTTLVAGAVISPSNNADQGNAKTFPAAVTVSVNGTRQNQTGYYLDGAPNIDIISNVNQPFPFPDALQEFSVQTSNYSAEYGQNAGGVVSIVSKSGQNQFHGSAFEFLRNRVFNAANYFGYVLNPSGKLVKTVDPLKRNQFGGTFGGPIRKDKTFFFGGYQGTRIRSNQGGQTAFVPTDANRAGNFSNISTAIKDPDNGGTFAGNQINPNRFDPAAVAMLAYLPQTADPTGRVFYSTRVLQNFDEYIARGDHSITSKDKLIGRYYYDRFYNLGSFGGNLLAYRQGSTISSHNAVIQEMHFFNSNLLNDFRFAFSRIVSIRQPPPETPNVADFGVNIYQPTNVPKQIQSLSVSSYFSTGANPTAKFPRTSYYLLDDVRWVHGRHSFSFGGIFEKDQLNMVNVLGLPGTFSFSGDTTGNALADFMLGRMRTFGQANGQHVKNRYWALNGYAQDSMRVNGRLTLSFGVRYEPSRVWHDLYSQNQLFRVENVASGTRSTRFPTAPAGLLFSGDPGVPVDGTTGDYRNIAPRVGFAWDVFGQGKTSLRGGFGMFYDSRVPAFSNNRMLGAAPFSATVSLTTPVGHFSNPYQGVTNPFPASFPPTATTAVFVSPVQIFTWDPNNKFFTPRIYMVNLGVEQDLGHGFMSRIAYVGSRGQYMTVTVDQNPAIYYATSVNGAACNLTTDQRRRYNNQTGACNNSAPPKTTFSNIYQQSNSGNSWYHSGQFTLSKPLSHGITILANYTFSKSSDTLPYNTDAATFGTSGYYVLPVTAPDFRRYDRGVSDYNHTNVFVTSYVWKAPSLEKMNSFVRQTAGNWEFSGIFTAESGAPLNLTAGTDQSKTGIGSDRTQYSGTKAYQKGSCLGVTTACRQWLNRSAFSLPAVGTFGNVGKGQFIGPGFWNWDMGVFKNFPVTEKLAVQFRGELFNTLNHTNFSTDNTGSRAKSPIQANPSLSSFGQIQAANDPRIIQLALKVVF